MIARYAVLVAALWGVLSPRMAASADTQPRSEAAQITVSGSAEVSIPPTEAAVSIEIKTSAPTAAAASAENARLSKQVTDALHKASLAPAELVGSQLTVQPQWMYDEATKRQKRTAFDANNSLQIKTAKLDKLSIYIDDALNAGATGISDIAFSAKETGAARRQALTQAVTEARQDAESLAEAGGGTLGDLLLLTTEQANRVPGVGIEPMMMSAARQRTAVSTDIVPSAIKVTATVLARWKFIPSH